MKRVSKALSLFFVFALLLCALSACAAQQNGGETVAPIDPGGESTPPEIPLTSALTGLACSAEEALARPVSFAINNEVNYKSSMKTYGLGAADIIYETNIEANYSGTRQLAVFSQGAVSATEQIGSVRSARPYFMTLAKMLDAYYVHEGESSADDAAPGTAAPPEEYARGLLKTGYVDNYWLQLEGKISYEDSQSIKSVMCLTEKAEMVYGTKLLEKLVSLYPRTAYADQGQRNAFHFGENKMEEALPGGYVKVIFAPWNAYYTQCDFRYDAATGLYERGQYLYPSMKTRVVPTDKYTGESLKFTNVFVLVTEQPAIDKDGSRSGNPEDDYHIKINLVGHSGSGYYFSGGKYVNITWKCDSDAAPMRFYTEDGAELTVNPGKSYVNLIHSRVEEKLSITE